MTILETSLGGGSGVSRLAPDLTMLEERDQADDQFQSEIITMVAGVEKEIFALSSKSIVGLLELSTLANESMTTRLIVDGVEIWDSTVVINDTRWKLWNETSSVNNSFFQVEASLSLLLTTTSDLSITRISSAYKVI